MSMIEWSRKANKDSLILFVHGLKGDIDTWSSSKNVSFPQLLLAEPEIEELFDVACFNYFTTFTSMYCATKSIWRKFLGSSNKLAKNLPVQEISELLIGEMDVNLSGYKQIILITHSMGGLIAKDCILKKIKDGSASQITGYISLAVPHSGAMIATIPSLISDNAQLVDLGLLSETTDALNRDWGKCTTLPISKYIYGSYDQYVNKRSAIPIHCDRTNTLAVDEDHSSICKPMNNTTTVFNAVKKFVLEINSISYPNLVVSEFVDDSQYDNEYFVLKMILADIHSDITMHAKEYYYNAELARNIFTSDHDRGILNSLYRNVRSIYQEEYEHHIAHDDTPDMFIYRVHNRISAEDKKSLDSVLRNLDLIHKKGMLHQLANKNNKDIVWSSDTCLDALNDLKRGA